MGDQTIEDFRLLNLSDLPVQLTKAIQIQTELIKELKKAKIILQNEMPVKRAVYKALGLFDLNKAKQKFDPDKFGHMLTTV